MSDNLTQEANAGHSGVFLDLPIGGTVVSSADQDSCIRWDFDNPIELAEITMRLSVLILLFIAAALLGESIGASAQSARSYRVCGVCAIYYGIDATSTPSCTFDTREQCMETISGIGGYCIENQYYHGPAVTPPGHGRGMRKRVTHPHQTSLR